MENMEKFHSHNKNTNKKQKKPFFSIQHTMFEAVFFASHFLQVQYNAYFIHTKGEKLLTVSLTLCLELVYICIFFRTDENVTFCQELYLPRDLHKYHTHIDKL